MKKLWNRLFLEERPSLGLAFFRIAAALTVGLHVIPSFFHLGDNYFAGALKEINPNFFPVGAIRWVQSSPDIVVGGMVVVFLVAWFCFLIGFLTQASCIVLQLASYYFYALNSFHIGTLSWDILLVTMFLLCLTPYPGDYFSIDALRGADPNAYRRMRPIFIQRLLQMQIASTFFYTALYKVTAQGNWLTGNPIHALMNYPPEGVTKWFLLKEYLAVHPDLCYGIGLLIVVIELLMPVLLFWPRTRQSAIILGFLFHVGLVWTLDVPTIFFFLFPAQLLLFINSKDIVNWIEIQRQENARLRLWHLLYDGQCHFCRNSVRLLKTMDMFNVAELINLHDVPDFSADFPGLTREAALSQMHLVDGQGRVFAGFAALRRLSWRIPMLTMLMPLLYFPGTGIVGPWVYGWVAKNRYVFHANSVCENNACFRRSIKK